MKTTTQILAALIIIGFPLCAVRAQESSGLHSITGVDVGQDGNITTITVEGTEGPTFSVYRLERPSRIFVDFSNSQLEGDVTNWTVRNGVVEDVLALQYREDQSLVTRVIVTLQTDEIDYDVDTNGSDVIVAIEGEVDASPMMVSEGSITEAEADDLRRAAADAETRTDEVLARYEEALHAVEGYQDGMADQQDELARLEDEAEQWRQEVSRLQEELTELRTQVNDSDVAVGTTTEQQDALSVQLAEAEQHLSEANNDRESAIDQAAESQLVIEAIQNEVERLQTDAATNETSVEELSENLQTLEERLLETTESEALQVEIAADLAEQLEEAEADLEDATESEQDSQEALNQLNVRFTVLETELEQLEITHGDRDALLEESEELEERRTELEDEIAGVQSDLTELETEAQDALGLRQRMELEAANAEALRNEAEIALNEATEARETAETATESARDELEETEELLSQRQLEQESLEEQLEVALSARDELQTQLEGLATNQLLQQQQLIDAQTEQTEIEAEVARLAELRAETQREVEEAEAERILSEQQLAELALQRTAVAEALAETERTRDAIDEEVAQLTIERDATELELAELALERETAESALSQIEENREQLSVELTELTEDHAEIARQVDEVAQERETAESELADLNAQREDLVQELSELEVAVLDTEEAEVELVELTERREQLTEDLESLELVIAQREEAESELGELSRRRDEVHSEIAEMEQLLSELETRVVDAETLAASPSNDAASEISDSAHVLQDPLEASREDPVEIVDVRFDQTNGVDRIIIEFSSEAPRVQSLAWDEGQAGLIIENGQLPEHLMRTLDTRAFNGPVHFISSFVDDNDEVRIVAEISSAATEILTSNEGMVSWEFTGVALEANYLSDPTDDFEGYNAQEEPLSSPPIHRPELGQRFTIGDGPTQLRTPDLARDLRVTIDLVNADVQNVLRLFSDEGDVNIIASDLSGSVTLRLLDVPLDLAFALILQSQGLGWEQRGNIIRVAPQATFDGERRRRLEQIAEDFDVEPLQVRLRPISYADGGGLMSLLGSVLSSRGSVSFDTRTHTLLLTDVPENLDAAEQLIDVLDIQTPQILIEARIVQTGESLTRGFGIQWGGDALLSPANGNATGLLFPSSIGIMGGAGSAPSTGTSSTPNYAVNVPGPGTGSVGFQFGSLGQAVNLNLRLSAAEATGSATVVSAPRILTLDGQAATISSGLSIPVQSVSAAGTNITFVSATLSLNVTPTVSPDGYIHLQVNVTKNEPDFGRTGANGDPSIITRSATTQLLVRDGETSVIGGIFEHVTGSSQTAVPFFADIPILGALFHNYQFQDERNETLVFITPRIVNREASLMNYTPGDVLMTPPTE